MAFSLCMDDGTLWYQGRLCVPNVDGLRERILIEAHTSRTMRTPRKFDSIWVIADRITKSAHFLPIKATDTAEQDLEFKEDDWVFLKISTHEGYKELVFHVSMLKKVAGDPSLIMPVETVEANEELTYEEIPGAILNRQVRKLRNKEITSVKVLWRNQQVEETTWEVEEEMKKNYPYLFE
ncbi:PREDICTED: uncharacterized protein LOC109224283 [Nicotiana attenuata]|uniref:uncharacterized protein LOC109224283 n=1 Tax=Nicotiana attenuata TaxID=49451 RepID=UPI0009046F90|nr:PREDICTED: uncharacterized protein LOC109224283 [Nicotiana attenuata]